jgi:D-glycero-alpha-D-manno-heptose-7-phosphate kinase
MIIVRSPLRITLGGGGTDLASYYTQHGGFLIAAAINKYVYITVHETFVPELIIKYSEMERVTDRTQIKHPVIREAMTMLDIPQLNLEISSMADIPAGTGLGSSGSFTTALLRALHAYKNSLIHPRELAEEACHIEIDRLGEPIGKQDQYIAAFGGVTCFNFHENHSVDAAPLGISEVTRYELEDHLGLFFTGYTRSAGSILAEQHTKSLKNDSATIENLHFVKQLGLDSKTALERGDLTEFAKLMNVHWEWKQRRSRAMTNERINEWYSLALRNGALGGKLIGAGGGGFLLFLSEDMRRLRRALCGAGMTEVRFRFDNEGTRVVTLQ